MSVLHHASDPQTTDTENASSDRRTSADHHGPDSGHYLMEVHNDS